MKDAGCSSRKQWKERIARRFRSHARIDSVCPYCKHVVCTQGCKDMQRQKDALLSWFYTCKDRKRSVSPSDNSASSDNANEFNMSEDDGYMSGEGGREGIRDPEMTPPLRSKQGNNCPEKALKPSQPARLVLDPPRTGTEILIHPPPWHVVGLGNDGGEELLFEAPGCSRAPSDHSDNDFARVVFERASRNSPLMISESRPFVVDRLAPCYVPKNGSDTTLVFESRFESGNLQRAVQTGDFCYDLYLCTDYNTNAHTQWFYFQVGNTRAGVSYRFNMVNLVKPRSLYGSGLQPLLYSSMKQQAHNVGWHRCGKNISYRMNPTVIERREETERQEFYRTLSFDVEFPFDDDLCYIAHCFPYTYTDLQRLLFSLQHPEEPWKQENAEMSPSDFLQRDVMCKTIARNKCHVLTITNMVAREAAGQDYLPKNERKGIVITARVHPGETNSSWMMDGILRFLTGQSEMADRLRNRFVFKIVPMLNPDGVVLGNYRTGLAGHDLNRRYVEASRLIHPTIYHLQRMVKRFKREREVALYIDLHGHSCKNNLFVYGCEAKGWRDWRIGQRNVAPPQLFSEFVFPSLLAEQCPSFSLEDCKFKIRKNKNATGRAYMWRDFGIANTFTLEVSFAGPRRGENANFHFGIKDLRSIGEDICHTIWNMLGPDSQKNFSRIIQQAAKKAEEEKKLRLMKVASEDDEMAKRIRSDVSDNSKDNSDSGSEGSGDESSDEETENNPFVMVRKAQPSAARTATAHFLSLGLHSNGLGRPLKAQDPVPRPPQTTKRFAPMRLSTSSGIVSFDLQESVESPRRRMSRWMKAYEPLDDPLPAAPMAGEESTRVEERSELEERERRKNVKLRLGSEEEERPEFSSSKSWNFDEADRLFLRRRSELLERAQREHELEASLTFRPLHKLSRLPWQSTETRLPQLDLKACNGQGSPASLCQELLPQGTFRYDKVARHRAKAKENMQEGRIDSKSASPDQFFSKDTGRSRGTQQDLNFLILPSAVSDAVSIKRTPQKVATSMMPSASKSAGKSKNVRNSTWQSGSDIRAKMNIEIAKQNAMARR